MCGLWNKISNTSLNADVRNAINSRKFSELCLGKVKFHLRAICA